MPQGLLATPVCLCTGPYRVGGARVHAHARAHPQCICVKSTQRQPPEHWGSQAGLWWVWLRGEHRPQLLSSAPQKQSKPGSQRTGPSGLYSGLGVGEGVSAEPAGRADCGQRALTRPLPWLQSRPSRPGLCHPVPARTARGSAAHPAGSHAAGTACSAPG